jgi:hypothetical protein
MEALQPLQIGYPAGIAENNRVNIERLRTKFYYFVLNRTKIITLLG